MKNTLYDEQALVTWSLVENKSNICLCRQTQPLFSLLLSQSSEGKIGKTQPNGYTVDRAIGGPNSIQPLIGPNVRTYAYFH